MNDYKKIIGKHKNFLLNRENVVGVGHGIKERNGRRTGEDAVVILVKQKLPVMKVKKKDLLPHRIDDCQTDVIEIGELGFHSERTVKLRPAQPGVSIGHYKISAGTLGAIVRDKKTGSPLILSNNHVLANITNGKDNRSKIGDPIIQPGAYDDGNNPDDIIAYLERLVPIHRGESEPECKIAIAVEKIANFIIHFVRPYYNFKLLKQGNNNIVDCAVARPKSDQLINSRIIEIGEIKGLNEAVVDMEVQKSGRTSGLTRGKVVAVDATVNVSMSETESANFEDQFITTPISKAGDSGSLVLDMDNNAVGLLFAGSDKATVCNRISNVIQALSIEI
ncbi:MAG: hypothetical protein ACLFPF_00210 [Halanaerobiales bacterium]